jgi:lipopolysaccharide/colanic/teichoic acid biosynthesis glycosyltransferase
MKRGMDLALSAVGLFFLLPSLGAISVAVWLSSGAPIFFRQRRVGRGGQAFALLKFRTMSVKAGAETGSFDAGNAQRVTSLGRVLRKSKLDELPQLWNVLKGDMSLVGPRPEVAKWVSVYPERWARVLSVRPGITDPASIRYRNEEQLLAASPDPERTYREEILPRKLDLYEEYVRTQSFWADIAIILKTLHVVVRGR